MGKEALATVTHHQCGQDSQCSGAAGSVKILLNSFFAFNHKKCAVSQLTRTPTKVGGLGARLQVNEERDEYYEISFPDVQKRDKFVTECMKIYEKTTKTRKASLVGLKELHHAASAVDQDAKASLSPLDGKDLPPVEQQQKAPELTPHSEERSDISRPLLPLQEAPKDSDASAQVGKPLSPQASPEASTVSSTSSSIPAHSAQRVVDSVGEAKAQSSQALFQQAPVSPPKPSRSVWANDSIMKIATATSVESGLDEKKRRLESEAKRRRIAEKAPTALMTSSQRREYRALPQRAPSQRANVLRVPASSSGAASAIAQSSAEYRSFRSNVTFGLHNLGNTCYLNAVLQAFCALREFIADLQAMAKCLPLCGEGPLFQSTLDIVEQLGKAATVRNGSLSPAKLRQQIARNCPVFGTAGQQDAHEFLLEYLNQLHDEMLGARTRWLAQRAQDEASTASETEAAPVLATQLHLDSELRKTLTCAHCRRAHDVSERFRDFSLDFCSHKSLWSMIDEYFSPETLEVKCEHCQAATAQARKELAVPPRVLILHLKRYIPNVQLQRYDKQHQQVDIPLELSFRARPDSVTGVEVESSASERGSQSSERSSQQPRLPARPLAVDAALHQGSCEILGRPLKPPSSAGTAVNDSAEEQPGPLMQRYKLRAVVAHSGASPHSGHYVCYAQSSTGEWRHFDDSSVWQCNMEQELLRIGRDAYILFYVACGDDAVTGRSSDSQSHLAPSSMEGG